MHDDAPSPLRTILSTIPALAILLLVVAQGVGEDVQARLLSVGEATWPGYAEVRVDPEVPDCDPAEYDAPAAPSAAGSADDDLLDDLFDDAPEAAPNADPDEDLLDDLFDDAPAEAPPSGAASDDDLLDDLFDDAPTEAPGPAGDDDLLDDLFDDEAAPSKEEAMVLARAEAKRRCEVRHARYGELQALITPTVRVWRAADNAVFTLTNLGREAFRYGLVLLVILGAATATAARAHISLRPVRSVLDARVSAGMSLIAELLAIASCLMHYNNLTSAGVEAELPTLPLMWAAGFALMALFDLRTILAPPADLEPGGSLGNAMLTAPLFTAMALVSSAWFLADNHPTGLAIYLDKLAEHAQLYIQVGLYVWVGMLLKRTRLAGAVFDVLRPWRMTPELLAAVVVALAAIPTAYSGASGIFVIAVGAVIFDELRKAGSRRQLALAATAMSGSLGVVLSPCLLVVIVASLNRQVTTTELFGAGNLVFLLTAGLFTAVVLLARQEPLRMAPFAEGWAGTRPALRGLLPYVLAGVAVVFGFIFILDTWPNENSAPRMLPIALLAMALWEARKLKKPTLPVMTDATAETTLHVGALLTLMAFSVGLGGVVERADVMAMVPVDFGSAMLTMGALVVALVGIGMVMDPYGAVILVSATLAPTAIEQGIDPLHFWMVVLVAFELGYLTPPVALNHLLARSVVGKEAEIQDTPADASFWYRHEKLLLPLTVMATGLVIVAFAPFAWMYSA